MATATDGDARGVVGRSASTEGIGVSGYATAASGGRGGWFSGSAAQIMLEPTSATHPVVGQMGDLFADTSGRLWFCKGDTDWKQVA